MNTPAPPKLGNVIDVDPAWVARVTEEALEPALPIVDPHHHLWQRAGNDYMFHDLLADTQTGHNIVATVFVDCHSMYRKEGPPELRCVGETEFANGVAAMSASGLYGNLRACAGIVSHVDLRLGAKAGAVFDAQIAAGNGRFIGIRYQTGLDKDPGIRPTRTNPTPGLMADKTWREGFARARPSAASPSTPGLYHPQLAEVADLAAAFPRHLDRPRPCRRPAGLRLLRQPPRRGLRHLEEVDGRAGAPAQRHREGGRARHGDGLVRFLPAAGAAQLADAGRRLQALGRDLHRAVRRRALHVRATSRSTRSPRATACCGMPSSG